MRVITNKNQRLDGRDRGESNGYLVIDDKNHPWFGKDHYEIEVDVHGGLTFSSEIIKGHISVYEELAEDDIGSWMIGFDTCHPYDSYSRWTDDVVRDHAEISLLKPALELSE